MIVALLMLISFLRELGKTRHHNLSKRNGQQLPQASSTAGDEPSQQRDTTGTFSSSLEDLQNTSASISETIYSSATSGTFKQHSSSICSDVTIPEDSRRLSEDQVRMPTRRYFGSRNRSRYGSRGSLPRRRRTTGRFVILYRTIFKFNFNFSLGCLKLSRVSFTLTGIVRQIRICAFF